MSFYKRISILQPNNAAFNIKNATTNPIVTRTGIQKTTGRTYGRTTTGTGTGSDENVKGVTAVLNSL